MWQWIKVPKAIALLAFALPWLTVSCSGTELVSATGFGLATGHLNVPPAVSDFRSGDIGHANIALLLAILAIVLGLIASFARRRIASRTTLLLSIVALLLLWLGTHRYSKSVLIAAASRRHGSAFDTTAASLIRVDWEFGYWLCLCALAVAAAMSLMVLLRRDAPPPSPAREP